MMANLYAFNILIIYGRRLCVGAVAGQRKVWQGKVTLETLK